ncbi:hypothetical protein E4U21_004840 [Claviceps maximensis]|nr:hypothetical protein E4U21_004840 [Claviceps maximensis]
MKSVAVVLSMVAAATAQDLAGAAQGLAALAQCGQTCANNMMTAAKAEELGCKVNDIKCLCGNVNFMYGLRDCSHAICSQQDANQVVGFGMKVCEGAGIAVTGGNAGASQTGGASPSHGEAHVTTIYGVVTGTDGKVMTAPIATSTIGADNSNAVPNGDAHVTTIHSTMTGTDGQAVTTPIATSTIDGGNAGNGGPLLSTFTTDGTQVVVTLSTMMTQPTSTDGEGATETPSGGAATTSDSAGTQTPTVPSASPTSTSTGFAAHITAAPGLLAAAGLAALLF